MLNARLIGGPHQSTFVECPLGGWRLYQRPMIPGGYVAMDGECRFQGPLFLHGSVHHFWRQENAPLPERPQHMLNSLKLNVPGTMRSLIKYAPHLRHKDALFSLTYCKRTHTHRFMAKCMLDDLLPDGSTQSTLSEHARERVQLAHRLLTGEMRLGILKRQIPILVTI